MEKHRQVKVDITQNEIIGIDNLDVKVLTVRTGVSYMSNTKM